MWNNTSCSLYVTCNSDVMLSVASYGVIDHRSNPFFIPFSRHSSSTDSKHFVLIKKSSPTAPLGIALVGGNSVGIFIKEVRPGSLAEEHSLRVGEQIIEVCRMWGGGG